MKPLVLTEGIERAAREYSPTVARVEVDALRAKLTECAAEAMRTRVALGDVATYNVRDIHGYVDEWTEAAAFTACQRIASCALSEPSPASLDWLRMFGILVCSEAGVDAPQEAAAIVERALAVREAKS